jgi:hypothetical protein
MLDAAKAGTGANSNANIACLLNNGDKEDAGGDDADD